MAVTLHASADAGFGRVLAMPNLKEPLTSVEAALRYIDVCHTANPRTDTLACMYLTQHTSADDIAAVAKEEAIIGFKLYPSGVTTGSQSGPGDLDNLDAHLDALQAHDVPLLIHAEDPDSRTDPFDREAVFLRRWAAPWAKRFPRLRMTIEHVTTQAGISFVDGAREGVAATITPHHLHADRSVMFTGGLNPHAYCLPVPKRRADMHALRRAALSGSPKYFFGTDSAPHSTQDKESACGCAGVFNATAALGTIAEMFINAGKLSHFEPFTSLNGSAFYRIDPLAERVALIARDTEIPRTMTWRQQNQVTCWRGGETLGYHIQRTT